MLTTDEYKEWIAYHKSLFPAFGVWLNDDLKVRGNAIFKSFQSFKVTLDDLKMASNNLIVEDPDVYPRTHCSAIVERIQNRRKDATVSKRLTAVEQIKADEIYREIPHTAADSASIMDIYEQARAEALAVKAGQ